jgi:hypothetical protein
MSKHECPGNDKARMTEFRHLFIGALIGHWDLVVRHSFHDFLYRGQQFAVLFKSLELWELFFNRIG